MRTLKAWGIFAAMCMFVFAVSGCGGGSLDGSVGDDPTPDPVSVPDTYNTREVLEGAWLVTDATSSFTAGRFTFRLNSARLIFDSIDMTASTADAFITSRQGWYTDFTSGDVTIDLGIQDLGLSFEREAGRMIHQEKDKWRCNVGAESSTKRIVMNITVVTDKVITVNYQGVTPDLYLGAWEADYNFTLTFRKEE